VTYDAFGSPVTVKYPDQDNGDGTAILNRTVTYDYNALGQVGAYRWDALTGDSRVPVDNNAINGTSYNAAGQPYAIAWTPYGFGSTLNFFDRRTYNTLNQLTY
jgi:hypothetical protein